MLNTKNKIILVDNLEEQLLPLSKVFFEENIGCLPMVYDSTYDNPLNGVRLAFFDINLLDSYNETQIISTIVETLPKYISLDNGPFALIFWTNKKELIPKIKKFINERGLKNKTPKPFIIDCIDKDEYLSDNKKLLKKLKLIFKDPTLNVLIDYENTVTNSVTKTVNEFFKIIPTKDKWGANKTYLDNFEKIFSSIAVSTFGYEHAKQNPDKAIYHALSETLKHHIEHATINDNWKSILKTLNASKKENDIKKVNRFNYSHLNNLFHIDNSKNITKVDRGVVIELDKKFLRKYGTNFRAFYDSMIPHNKRVPKKAKIIRLIDSSKLICVEISAGCDHSQNKNRINKYIFGIITRNMKQKDYELNKQIPSNSYPLITYLDKDDNENQIWLNFNFVVGLESGNNNLRKVLFCLKNELVNQIGNRYANHISRIGITSF